MRQDDFKKIYKNLFKRNDINKIRFFLNAIQNLLVVGKGIARFGIRSPFIPGAPFVVVWNITNKCNLKCKHCYSDSSKINENHELSTEEAIETINKLHKSGVSIIIFSGGEPLVRKDFFQIARHAFELGIFTIVATNGTLLTNENLGKLKQAGVVFLQISLDGTTPETHDKFRGISGAFEKTLQGIKNSIEKDFFVSVATTLTKQNVQEIPKMVDLCDELKVNWLIVFNFIPTGRGQFIAEQDVSPEEREQLLKTLWEKQQSVNVRILSTAPQYSRVALQLQPMTTKKSIPGHYSPPINMAKRNRINKLYAGCGIGTFYCGLDANGDIKPCVFLPIKIGNILKDDFDDIWVKNKILNDIRERSNFKGNCGKCEHKSICGGCRSRAYAYFNDYLGPDPGCIYNKNSLVEKRKIASVSK